jgi:hypothetical protein
MVLRCDPLAIALTAAGTAINYRLKHCCVASQIYFFSVAK